MNNKYFKMMMIGMIMVLAFTACGNNITNKNTGTKLEETLGQKLLDEVKFKDKLEPVDEKAIENLYGITKEQYTAAKVYMSTGATAEEIAVFRVDADDKAATIEDALKARVEDQKSIMKDYLPNEMTKLDNAIIKSKDHYVILCITDDVKNAQKIIDKSF